MSDDRPTASELEELLATMLAGVVGGDENDWKRAIGAVEVLDIVWHPKCNWTVNPTGSIEQVAAIGAAAAVLADAHPYARKI
jgi:hypothetical protein